SMTRAGDSRENAPGFREDFPTGKSRACRSLLASESHRHGGRDSFADARMGFFSSSDKPQPNQPASGGVTPRLAEAKAKLEARDVPAAVAIYQEVLASAG